MEKTIQEYLSALKNTKPQRFNFVIPDSIESDLLACYKSAVNSFGDKDVFILTEEVKRNIKSLANWFKSGKSGLLLQGSIGTGKSKLAQAINVLIKFYTKDVSQLKIFTAKEINDYSCSQEEEEQQIFSRLKSYLYLAIDDFGVGAVTVKNYGTELSPVVETLYQRYDNNKTTIITTNLSLEAIEKRYGERIKDRLIEQYDRIIFDFKSFRK